MISCLFSPRDPAEQGREQRDGVAVQPDDGAPLRLLAHLRQRACALRLSLAIAHQRGQGAARLLRRLLRLREVAAGNGAADGCSELRLRGALRPLLRARVLLQGVRHARLQAERGAAVPLLAQDPHGRGGRLQEQMMIIGRKEGDNTHKIHSVSNTLNTTYDDDVYVSRNKAAGSCQKRGRLKRWKTRYKSSEIESRRRDNNPSAPNRAPIKQSSHQYHSLPGPSQPFASSTSEPTLPYRQLPS